MMGKVHYRVLELSDGTFLPQAKTRKLWSRLGYAKQTKEEAMKDIEASKQSVKENRLLLEADNKVVHAESF